VSTSLICLDANAVVLLVADPKAKRIIQLWAQWISENRNFIAPTMLYYEVFNALYQYHRHGLITKTTLTVNLQTAMSLPIQLHMDAGLHQRAVELAIKYGLPATYDAHYLAVAEQFGAELWTADGKFYRKVASLTWVKQIETEADV
jgi:predicted nucleic acid-binding protein